MPPNIEQRTKHRNIATELSVQWNLNVVQARYHHEGYWYKHLERFPAALLDQHGYIIFDTEQAYMSAGLRIGKQIYAPKPGISALIGYVRFDKLSVAPVDNGLTLTVEEGKRRLRLHWVRERDSKIVDAKKESTWQNTGKLVCEACEFDFHAFYGDHGKGFAECHHLLPISALDEPRETTLADLAIVCANCHRMLHRRPWLSVAQLQHLLAAHKKEKPA